MRAALFCAVLACAPACRTTGEVTPDPPRTSLSQTPEALTASDTATFGFTADHPEATFDCALDDAAAESCASPATYAGLAEGEHTFTVTASNAGGPDPEPPSFTWTISATAPPVAQITGGPDAHWGSPTATLWFVSDVPATFACAMDGAAAAACTSPATYTGLAGGEHTFTVAASAGGVTQAAPASYTFEVDLAPPVTTVDSAPPDPVNQTTATFSFHADEDATFTCQVDDEVPLPCASPATWDDLAAGPHRVRIWGTDAVGNVQVPGITTEWSIDLGAPDTTLSDSPSDPSNEEAPTFTFTSDEDGSFLCTLDGGAAAPCTSPHTTVALGEGPHTFSVAAVDPAGNVDPDPPSYTWTVDVTPTAAPATATATPGNRSVNVSWAAVSGADGYGVYVDDGTTETLVGGLGGTAHTVTGLANCATYTVSVVAVDEAGNESPRATASPVSPKPTTPASFVLSPQTNGNVQLSWSSVSNATGYRVVYGAASGGPYDGTAASMGASPVSVAGTNVTTSGLAPTTATYFAVSAVDGACESTPSVERAYDCTNTLALCTTDATVDGVTASFRQIWSVPQLPRVSAYPADNYILMQDISVSNASLSQLASTLGTHFYGNGKTISNYSTSSALFGTVAATGKVSDLIIRSATISSSSDSGLIARENWGLVTRSDVAGTSSGGGYNGGQGMMVARNWGVIRDSVASGTLSSSAYANSAGGFVGVNMFGGLIDGCTSDVNVNGTGQLFIVGGLVGLNSSGGSITRSTANGSVTKSGSDSPQVGGLVGVSSGLIDRSSATGNVTANSTYGSANGLTGGLVGRNAYGTITRSFATGDVSVGTTAQNRAGGLVGENQASYTADGNGIHIPLGVVVDSYALGDVLGNAQAGGGLVGFNSGGVVKRSWSGGDVSAASAGGFFGWYNSGAGTALDHSFCLGSASGSSNDPFGVYISSGTVLNGWFLGETGDTSPTGALVVTDPAVFVDAATYGLDASGTPALPWDVDYIWRVDGENLPTLLETDIVLTASPSTVPASGGTITATVTVTDEQGFPAEGIPVKVWSTNSAMDFTPDTGTTDANGVFTSAVTSSSAANQPIQALVFDGIWAVPAAVTFE